MSRRARRTAPRRSPAAPAARVLELAAEHQLDQLRLVELRDRARADLSPSRRTVNRSAIANTSFSRCETKTVATPCRASAGRREERLHLVVGERARRLVEDEDARVGRERAGDLDHLLLVGPQPPDGRSGRCRAERASASLRPTPRLAPVDEPPRGGLRGPRKMFSATERSAASASPGYRRDARRERADGSPNASRAVRRDRAPSAWTCAETIFSSVDLPEPFSPTSPCTSPG